jgi:hypothetical protein
VGIPVTSIGIVSGWISDLVSAVNTHHVTVDTIIHILVGSPLLCTVTHFTYGNCLLQYPTLYLNSYSYLALSSLQDCIQRYITNHSKLKRKVVSVPAVWTYGTMEVQYILKLSSSWRWDIIFILQLLYPWGNHPQHPLNRRLGGPQSHFRHFGEG